MRRVNEDIAIFCWGQIENGPMKSDIWGNGVISTEVLLPVYNKLNDVGGLKLNYNLIIERILKNESIQKG